MQQIGESDADIRNARLYCNMAPRGFNVTDDTNSHARRVRRAPRSILQRRYCMNNPWLMTSDWPVSAFEGKAANNSATSATSATVAAD